MALTENRKIAIWPTAKAAFGMLWAARKQHVVLSFLAILPLAFASIYEQTPHQMMICYLIWDLVWLIPLGILWQRLFLMGPDYFLKVTAGQLFMIWIRLVGYYFALVVAILGIGLIMTAATYSLFWLWQTSLGITEPRTQNLVTVTMTMIFILLSLILAARVMPTYVGVSVEEKITPRKAWSLMEGNAGRLLVTILALLVCATLLGFIVGAALGFAARLIVGPDGITDTTLLTWGGFVISLLISPLLMAGLGLHTATQAIIYRDLVPQPEHLVDVTV